MGQTKHRRGGWLFGRDGSEPGWYGHWQNLNEGPTGEPAGSALLHGRAYVYPTGNDQMALRASWKLGIDAGTRLALNVDSGDGEALLSVGVGIAALYIGIEARWLHDALYAIGMTRKSRHDKVSILGIEREVSLRFHDGSVWWRAWADPNEWCSTPRWRDGSLSLDKLLRGEETVIRRPLACRTVQVPMPERSYDGVATFSEVRIERPRWLTKVFTDVKITMCDGDEIPIPGKGESSWDIDDDATRSFSAPASSIEDAIGQFVASTLKRRLKYGGKRWHEKLRARQPPPPAGSAGNRGTPDQAAGGDMHPAGIGGAGGVTVADIERAMVEGEGKPVCIAPDGQVYVGDRPPTVSEVFGEKGAPS